MAVDPENGKRAVTHYRVKNHLNRQFNHIECRLETGRTHQIRVHMASIMHPLLGDTVYGPKKDVSGIFRLSGQCLHAGQLQLTHPRSGEPLTLEAPLPDYFTRLLTRLGPII